MYLIILTVRRNIKNASKISDMLKQLPLTPIDGYQNVHIFTATHMYIFLIDGLISLNCLFVF